MIFCQTPNTGKNWGLSYFHIVTTTRKMLSQTFAKGLSSGVWNFIFSGGGMFSPSLQSKSFNKSKKISFSLFLLNIMKKPLLLIFFFLNFRYRFWLSFHDMATNCWVIASLYRYLISQLWNLQLVSG